MALLKHQVFREHMKQTQRSDQGLLAFSKVCCKTHLILGFRELGNNSLMCLALHKLLLNYLFDFDLHILRGSMKSKRKAEMFWNIKGHRERFLKRKREETISDLVVNRSCLPFQYLPIPHPYNIEKGELL